jgi:hypothetical protein
MITKQHINVILTFDFDIDAFHSLITYSAIKVFNKLPPSTSRLKMISNFLGLLSGIIVLPMLFILQKSLYQISSSF